MKGTLTARNIFIAALVAFLMALPVYAALTGNSFLLTLFNRIIILALAATSLNLIMGFGGMVSFGHAAYLGIGGYVVGILAYEGISSGFVQWPLAILISALFYTTFGLFMSWMMKRTIYAIMMSYTFVIGFLIIGTTLITGILSMSMTDGNLFSTCPLMWINPVNLMIFAFLPDTTPNASLFLIYGLLCYVMLTMLMLWRMIVGFRQVVVEA